MTERQTELRRELYAALSWHMIHKDRSPLDTLERLVRKASGIVASNKRMKIAAVMLSASAIEGRSLTPQGLPRSAAVPVIVVRDGERNLIVDGQKRVAAADSSGALIRALVLRFV